MSTHSPTDNAPAANGPDPYSRSLHAYVVALREDPVLGRTMETYVPTTALTPLGPADALDTTLGATRLVLVGPPGSGKTTVLRVAAATLARDAISPGQTGTYGDVAVTGMVPVYVDLATARDGEGVDDILARTLASATPEAPHDLRGDTPTVLFIDNLDLATDVYLLEGLELLLRAGGRAGPAVVLSCREGDWPAYRSWFEDVTTAELQPLSPTAVIDALHASLPPATAAAAERWLGRDRSLASAVRSPVSMGAFLTAVRDRSADRWRRGQVLDALLDAVLTGIPSAERPAYRAALADVALDSLGQGRLVEVDTVAMGLGVTRDDMIRTGAVVAHGSALAFVEPLLAQHCAASRLANRAAADPRRLAERLGDLSDPTRGDTLVHVYHLAPDPAQFIMALLPLNGGPELAARCLTEPDAADPAGPAGGATVVDSLLAQAPEISAPTLYRLGEALMRAGHDEAAEVALRAALAQSGDGDELDGAFGRPDVDEAPPVADWVREFLNERNRGLVLRGVSDPARASEALSAADEALERLGADLTFERGLAAADTGDLDGALAAFETAVRSEPDRARYIYHYGRALRSADRLEEAVGQLERARELAPSRPQIEAALGETYRARGWLKESLASYEKARRLAPGQPAYEQVLGELMAELGDLDEAAAAMRRSTASRPDEASWQDALGQVLGEMGEWPAAVRAFATANSLEPDHVVYARHLGRARLGAGETTEAVEVLRRAADAAPDDPGVLSDLGRALSAEGDGEEALDVLGRAIALDDAWPADHLLMARLLRRDGNLDAALERAQRAVELAPVSAVAMSELGHVHDARGDHQDALAAYKQAMEWAPEGAAALAVGVAATEAVTAAVTEPPAEKVADDTTEQSAEAETPEAAMTAVVADATEDTATPAPDTEAARTEASATDVKQTVAPATAVAQAEVPATAAAQAVAPATEAAQTVAPATEAAQAEAPGTARIPVLWPAALAATRQRSAAADGEAETDMTRRMARLHAESGDLTQAIEQYEVAREADPTDPALATALGAVLVRAGRPTDAIDVLESAWSPDEDYGPLLVELAGAYEESGRDRDALEAYRAAAVSGAVGPEPALKWSRVARRIGSVDIAIEAARLGLAERPGWAQGYATLSDAYAAADLHESALNAMGRAAEIAPDNPEYRERQAQLALELGRGGDAIDALTSGIATCPDSAELHYALGRVLESRNRVEEAQASYARAAQLDPENAKNLSLPAGELAGEELDEAIDRLIQVSDERPDDPDTHVRLAALLASDGNEEEALEQLRLALALAPERPDVHRELGRCLTRQDAPGALDALEESLALDPQSGAGHAAMGEYMLRAGRIPAALDAYAAATRLAPNEPAYWRTLGEVRLGRADAVGAAEALSEAVRLDPSDAAAYVALGRAYEQTGQAAEAGNSYRKAVQLSGEGLSGNIELGRARMASGDIEGAVDSLEKAVAIGPDDAAACALLARACVRSGRLDEAMENARRATELAPEDSDAWRSLGEANRARGELDAASAALTEATSLAPDEAPGWVALAELAEAMGDPSRALAAYDHALEVAPGAGDVAARYGELSATEGYTRFLVAPDLAPPMTEETATRVAAMLQPLFDDEDAALAARAGRALAVVRGRSGDESGALSAAERSMSLDARAPSLLLVAWAQLLTGRPDRAVDSLERARELGADALTCMVLGARARWTAGDRDGAIAELRRAVEETPEDAEIHGALGAAYVALDQSEAALVAYRHAQDLRPDIRWALEIGRLAEAIGRPEEALEALESSADRLPHDARFQKQLADARLASGDVAGGIAALELVTQLEPNRADWIFELATVKRTAGDLEGACDGFTRAAEIEPNVTEYRLAAAETAAELGDADTARTMVTLVLAQAPDEVAAHELVGRLALDDGDLDGARDAFAAALQLDPADARAHYWLGVAAKSANDMGSAQEHLESAARLDDASGDTFLALGEVYVADGMLDDAIQALQQAVVCEPEAIEPHMRLGNVCAEAGLTEKSLAHLQRAAELAPEDFRPRYAMAQAYVRAQELDRAVEAFEDAVAKDPEDPEVFFDAGLAYKHLRDYGRAKSMFKSVTQIAPANKAAYTQLAAVSALHFLDRVTPEGTDD